MGLKSVKLQVLFVIVSTLNKVKQTEMLNVS
jgi:hypothetical protein